MTAFPMNRRLFGDLYPDVETLALAGKIVTRVGSNFRVDSNPEILTAAQIRGMAAKERNRKWETTVLDTRSGRDGSRSQSEGHVAGPAKKSRDATPRGCVDGAASPIVPPVLQSQTAGVPPAASSVTPAITAGIVAGSNIAQASKGKGVKWVAPPRVCERCGGPRSYWSVAFCKGCFQIKRQPGPTQERRIQALEQRAAELEVTVARLLGQMAIGGGE